MEKVAEFLGIAAGRAFELTQAKAEGKKIVAYVGNFIPVELIYAAGAEAFPLGNGGEPEPPEAVFDDVLRYMNPMCRTIAGRIKMKLDPVTPIADLIACSQNECHVDRLAEYFELLELPVQKVGVPADWKRDFAAEYYYNQLVELKEKLEELTGNKITDEKLKEQIALTNEINDYLGKISDLRKQNNPPIGGYEFIRVAHAVMLTNPEIAAKYLKEIYEELKDAPGKFSKDAPRLHLFGHCVAIGDYVVVKRLEDQGAVIVDEFLDEVYPWYQWNISTDGEPLRALWKRLYLDKVPADFQQPGWRERIEYVKERLKEYNADGMIWYNLLYDEIYDLEYSCVAKWMQEIDMPLMRIETSYEYTREAMMPLNTRIESFLEVLSSRKVGF